MNLEQKVIDRAIAGGYIRNLKTDAEMLLDPSFFQALGKAEGWEGYMQEGDTREILYYSNGNLFGWIAVWHRFIDHIAESKPVDDFFKELLK